MLKEVGTSKTRLSAVQGEFVIVASRYNTEYVDPMVKAAKAELRRSGAKAIRVVRVPGAYEIPIVAARLARLSQETESGSRALAIICLGVILRGETTHAAHIGEAVSSALMQIQLGYQVPVIHEVLLLETRAQAEARCISPKHNRGTEAAQTAVAMAQVMHDLG